MKTIALTGLMVALLSQGAMAAATPTPVKLVWHGLDTAGVSLTTKDTTVSTEVPVTSDFPTTALSYSYLGSTDTFAAFCLEPNQGNGRKSTATKTWALDYSAVQVSHNGDVATPPSASEKHLQQLFSVAYTSTMSYNDKAAFQLAVWEFARESNTGFDVTAGTFQMMDTGTASAGIAAKANSFIQLALAYNGADKYELTKFTSASLQDVIAATPRVSPVPEPESYALFLGGLGVIGLLVRRRLPR